MATGALDIRIQPGLAHRSRADVTSLYTATLAYVRTMQNNANTGAMWIRRSSSSSSSAMHVNI